MMPENDFRSILDSSSGIFVDMKEAYRRVDEEHLPESLAIIGPLYRRILHSFGEGDSFPSHAIRMAGSALAQQYPAMRTYFLPEQMLAIAEETIAAVNAHLSQDISVTTDASVEVKHEL